MDSSQASVSWLYKGAWEGVAGDGWIGRQNSDAIEINLLCGLGAALLIISEEQRSGFEKAIEMNYGLAPPPAGQFAVNSTLELIWAGPNKWLALSDDLRLAQTLAPALNGLAAVSDQSGSRAVLSARGKKTPGLLAKGLAIDIYPRCFKPGDAAMTSIAHIGVHIWQTDAAPSYKLALPRSMAASFWSWIEHAGAEYGLKVSTLQ